MCVSESVCLHSEPVCIRSAWIQRKTDGEADVAARSRLVVQGSAQLCVCVCARVSLAFLRFHRLAHVFACARVCMESRIRRISSGDGERSQMGEDQVAKDVDDS